jgi:hypothetical protein
MTGEIAASSNIQNTNVRIFMTEHDYIVVM